MDDFIPTQEWLLEPLDALPDPAWCEGTSRLTVPLTLAISGAGARAIDAPDLVAWLAAHCEPAPYGDETGTHVDRRVRDTLRVVARAATSIAGLELAAILVEVERALASDCRLAAELLDVLVYPPGAAFVSHKDTPRHDDQLGTLVIELPHPHHGGALRLIDGDRAEVVDWSQPTAPGTVRWVALFGDVDHAIERVDAGVRLTAVYTLRYRMNDRLPAPQRAGLDAITDAMITLQDPMCPIFDQIAIPCSRMIVTPRDPAAPRFSPGVLRGVDRLIAAALARAGMDVCVRECIAIARPVDQPLEAAIWDADSYRRAALVARALPDDELERCNAISLFEQADGFQYQIANLYHHVEDPRTFPRDVTWLVRRRARVTCRTMEWSHTGYYGNENSPHHVYRFATLLADVP